MRDNSKVIDSTGWESVITVNEGETLVCTGEFYRLKEIGFFKKVWEDSVDTIKLYGRGQDGKIYVSEKDDSDKTDEEFADWAHRSGADDFSNMIFLTKEEADKIYNEAFNGGKFSI